MLDIDELDPARLPQRKSKSDYVELVVSRSHETDDVWVGHNEAQDRTMSAMGKILLDPMNGKAISDIDGQSDRVFLRRVSVPAVPLLKTSYPQLIPCQRVRQRCSRSSTAEGNGHLQIFLVFFPVWSD